MALLAIDNLNAWYDYSHVLQGVTLHVAAGEIVTLVGRNGAGKTTTLRTVMGLVTKKDGRVTFDGADILGEPAYRRYHRGLGYVPEERRIVPGLSVLENLQLGLIASPHRARESEIIDRIAQTFPRLKQRLDQLGETLSGGEQQMLAIARAMMSEPKMILLDEPSEGIMPILADEMFRLFVELKEAGTTILLVEQNVERALEISDRAYIMDHGVIVHHDTAAKLLTDKAIQERYCAV
jgi:branched-chain amino acid transport system ATP-binding protein